MNDETVKFGQFGWRCTTTECSYSTDTLIGNWNEQRFDINRMKEVGPVISPYSYNFQTTKGAAFGSRMQNDTSVETLRYIKRRLIVNLCYRYIYLVLTQRVQR